MSEVRDLLVETQNPEFLDDSIQGFGAAVVGRGTNTGFIRIKGAYVVRCFSNSAFIKFAIENQGYGEVVKTCEGLYQDEESQDK